MLKVLLDRFDFGEGVRDLLEREGLEIHDLTDRGELLDRVAGGCFDVIFLGGSCKEEPAKTVRRIKELDPRAEIVFIGEEEEHTAIIEAIKSGTTACLIKPVDLNRLKQVLDEIRELVHIRRETASIERLLHEKYIFAGMVSRNPVMLDIFSLIRRLAPHYRTVLITGETGTGKEVLARALHDLSPWADEPFVVCNCSALVEGLIESELFGHVKGAFTGAVSDKKGLFEAAGNGTILLDEIGEMPLSFQPHLLRVLQDGEIRRVGSHETIKTNCRVIATTNVDLYERVKKGLFREDLFFRLAVITIKLPPLRERKEDIPFLCRFFLERFRQRIGKNILGISRPAQSMLMAYNWPGNIRELENVLERAILVTTEDFIRPQDLPSYIRRLKQEVPITSLTLAEVEKNHIRSVLTTTGGNKTRAAHILGISRRSLLRKIQKYGLQSS